PLNNTNRYPLSNTTNTYHPLNNTTNTYHPLNSTTNTYHPLTTSLTTPNLLKFRGKLSHLLNKGLPRINTIYNKDKDIRCYDKGYRIRGIYKKYNCKYDYLYFTDIRHDGKIYDVSSYSSECVIKLGGYKEIYKHTLYSCIFGRDDSREVGGDSNRGSVLGGVSNRGSMLEGVSNRGSEVEGVSNSVDEVGGDSNKDLLEGVNNSRDILEGVSNSVDNYNPVSNTTSNYHPVSSITSNYNPVNSSTSNYNPVSSSTSNYHPVSNCTSNYHPTTTTTNHINNHTTTPHTTIPLISLHTLSAFEESMKYKKLTLAQQQGINILPNKRFIFWWSPTLNRSNVYIGYCIELEQTEIKMYGKLNTLKTCYLQVFRNSLWSKIQRSITREVSRCMMEGCDMVGGDVEGGDMLEDMVGYNMVGGDMLEGYSNSNSGFSYKSNSNSNTSNNSVSYNSNSNTSNSNNPSYTSNNTTNNNPTNNNPSITIIDNDSCIVVKRVLKDLEIGYYDTIGNSNKDSVSSRDGVKDGVNDGVNSSSVSNKDYKDYKDINDIKDSVMNNPNIQPTPNHNPIDTSSSDTVTSDNLIDTNPNPNINTANPNPNIIPNPINTITCNTLLIKVFLLWGDYDNSNIRNYTYYKYKTLENSGIGGSSVGGSRIGGSKIGGRDKGNISNTNNTYTNTYTTTPNNTNNTPNNTNNTLCLVLAVDLLYNTFSSYGYTNIYIKNILKNIKTIINNNRCIRIMKERIKKVLNIGLEVEEGVKGVNNIEIYKCDVIVDDEGVNRKGKGYVVIYIVGKGVLYVMWVNGCYEGDIGEYIARGVIGIIEREYSMLGGDSEGMDVSIEGNIKGVSEGMGSGKLGGVSRLDGNIKGVSEGMGEGGMYGNIKGVSRLDGVSNSTNTLHPVSNSTNTLHPVSNSTNTLHPVSNSTITLHPVSNTNPIPKPNPNPNPIYTNEQHPVSNTNPNPNPNPNSNNILICSLRKSFMEYLSVICMEKERLEITGCYNNINIPFKIFIKEYLKEYLKGVNKEGIWKCNLYEGWGVISKYTSFCRLMVILRGMHVNYKESKRVMYSGGRGEGDRDSGDRDSGRGEGDRDSGDMDSGRGEGDRDSSDRDSGRGEGDRDMLVGSNKDISSNRGNKGIVLPKPNPLFNSSITNPLFNSSITNPLSNSSITNTLSTNPLSNSSITNTLSTNPLSTSSITNTLSTNTLSTSSITNTLSTNPLSNSSITNTLSTNLNTNPNPNPNTTPYPLSTNITYVNNIFPILSDSEWIKVEKELKDIIINDYSVKNRIESSKLTQGEIRDIIFGIELIKREEIMKCGDMEMGGGIMEGGDKSMEEGGYVGGDIEGGDLVVRINNPFIETNPLDNPLDKTNVCINRNDFNPFTETNPNTNPNICINRNDFNPLDNTNNNISTNTLNTLYTNTLHTHNTNTLYTTNILNTLYTNTLYTVLRLCNIYNNYRHVISKELLISFIRMTDLTGVFYGVLIDNKYGRGIGVLPQYYNNKRLYTVKSINLKGIEGVIGVKGVVFFNGSLEDIRGVVFKVGGGVRSVWVVNVMKDRIECYESEGSNKGVECYESEGSNKGVECYESEGSNKGVECYESEESNKGVECYESEESNKGVEGGGLEGVSDSRGMLEGVSNGGSNIKGVSYSIDNTNKQHPVNNIPYEQHPVNLKGYFLVCEMWNFYFKREWFDEDMSYSLKIGYPLNFYDI
ncbi:PrP8 U6-snRNA-interacting domain-containing protein, partial [Hamiltosporidium tvaerminnensis]